MNPLTTRLALTLLCTLLFGVGCIKPTDPTWKPPRDEKSQTEKGDSPDGSSSKAKGEKKTPPPVVKQWQVVPVPPKLLTKWGLSPEKVKARAQSHQRGLPVYLQRGGAKMVKTRHLQRLIHTFPAEKDGILALEVTRNGKLLAGAGQNGETVVWNLETKKEVHRLVGHRDAVTGLSFDMTGSYLATCSKDRDQSIRIWNVKEGYEVRSLDGHKYLKGSKKDRPASVYSVAVSPLGKFMVSGGGDEALRLWNLADGKAMDVLQGHDHGVTKVAFSPNGARLASANGQIFVWNMLGREKKILHKFPGHIHPQTKNFGDNALAFSSDGSFLAVGGKDGKVVLWNIENGSKVRTFYGGGPSIKGLAFLGKTIAAAGRDGAIRLWDSTTGTSLGKIDGHQGAVQALAVSPDQKYLYSAGRDGLVKTWDMSPGVQALLPERFTGKATYYLFPSSPTILVATPKSSSRHPFVLFVNEKIDLRTGRGGEKGKPISAHLKVTSHSPLSVGEDATLELTIENPNVFPLYQVAALVHSPQEPTWDGQLVIIGRIPAGKKVVRPLALPVNLRGKNGPVPVKLTFSELYNRVPPEQTATVEVKK